MNATAPDNTHRAPMHGSRVTVINNESLALRHAWHCVAHSHEVGPGPQNHDDPLVDAGDHPLVQPHTVTKIGHANYICELKLSFPLTQGTVWILYACQLVRNGATRVYKLIARDELAHDRAHIHKVADDEDVILLEDLNILSALRLWS